MHAKTPTDDLADALDEGANRLAEAIALDFGGKSTAPQMRLASPTTWGRWLRSAFIAGDTAYGIALGAPRPVPRPAQ